MTQDLREAITNALAVLDACIIADEHARLAAAILRATLTDD